MSIGKENWRTMNQMFSLPEPQTDTARPYLEHWIEDWQLWASKQCMKINLSLCLWPIFVCLCVGGHGSVSTNGSVSLENTNYDLTRLKSFSSPQLLFVLFHVWQLTWLKSIKSPWGIHGADVLGSDPQNKKVWQSPRLLSSGKDGCWVRGTGKRSVHH